MEREGGTAPRTRLSAEWFVHQAQTWRGLVVGGYVFLGLCALPLLFNDAVPRTFLIAWYVVALGVYGALAAWLAVRIRHSLRWGRRDLRGPGSGAPPEEEH